ncbi:MAG TPA: RDD family protein [Stellaceae bacterium]|nr:RDD family protein [Stellaceae bacterium]
MNYAGIGIRFIEGFIDLLVTFVILWIIALLTGQTTDGGFQLKGAPMFIGVAVAILYFIVMEGLFGATAGKLLLKLRVVKADGSPIGWRESILRNVLRIIDGFALYLVGFIVVCATAKRQRIGDMAAGTVVVRSA